MNPAAVGLVMEFIAARHDWEVAAQRLIDDDADVRPGEVVSQIQAEHDGLVAVYCTPRVIAKALRAAVGSPPSVDPVTTRVVSVISNGPKAIVVTREIGSATEEYDVEYHLVELDRGWCIDDRRVRVSGGGWVRLVL